MNKETSIKFDNGSEITFKKSKSKDRFKAATPFGSLTGDIMTDYKIQIKNRATGRSSFHKNENGTDYQTDNIDIALAKMRVLRADKIDVRMHKISSSPK
jgi:hypothetical protein